MNCSNCGSRISTLKCEYCGTLNAASPQQKAILSEHGKKRANLVEKLKTIEKMKMPESIKQKKVEVIQKQIIELDNHKLD